MSHARGGSKEDGIIQVHVSLFYAIFDKHYVE